MNRGRDGPDPHGACGAAETVAVVVDVDEASADVAGFVGATVLVGLRVVEEVDGADEGAAVDEAGVSWVEGGAPVDRVDVSIVDGGAAVDATGARKSQPHATLVLAHIQRPGSQYPELLVRDWQKLSPTGPGQAP